ncbi:glycosyltransferase family 2 protein [Candidatus Colwellia aromaticivorans]|uniref:glycosyltransferase family 2 protein n=1 Tax=Candidatus Colwellia aromaticivorans TaxID=2267621 RepID=UPI000DF3BDE7|nr:glycosyltransferase family 2 protein [Candidatus Colwellia aromaticivorans]
MSAKVSVIMPVYNAEKYIDETIQSFLNQTYPNKELIIVDDCSSDNSYEIALQYSSKHPEIRTSRLAHNSGGPSIPKNTGIKMSSGQFICFLDHDDYDASEKISELVRVFDSYQETQVVFCDVYGMDESGKKEQVGTLARSNYVERAANYLTQCEQNIYQCNANYLGAIATKKVGISTQGVMIKKDALSVLEYHFNPEYGSCDDIDLWVRLIINFNVKFYNKPLAYFRKVGQSLSSQKERLLSDAAKYHQEHLHIFKDNLEKEEFIVYQKHLSSIFFRLGYVLSRKSPTLSRQNYIQSIRYQFRLQTIVAFLKTYIFQALDIKNQ